MWFDSNLQLTPAAKRQLWPQLFWWRLNKMIKAPFQMIGWVK